MRCYAQNVLIVRARGHSEHLTHNSLNTIPMKFRVRMENSASTAYIFKSIIHFVFLLFMCCFFET